MSLHTVDCDYAHRLATMLECALLNRLGSWDEGHALLDEYRAACRAAMPDAPTFMGEPVIDDVYTAELVELDGHTYGLRPGAARVVREALLDARRYKWLRDTPGVSWDELTDGGVSMWVGDASAIRAPSLDAAIDAAMAKDGA